ncbi:RsmD family RNA methyltransferase [Campylobacter sp. MIT 21-1685]|uniref:RsmD family RNA methyltransferase n=1 Tax=unclassified Campylobacter TaxID=2593542 RepID=UPI00224A6868|nr:MULTISPECIES: RsmD family RNA methyltransferase [unclassified Campylobacter]MCX2683236.1 RsmD family RNA methyltransferase [Campylobacter sp. MIT 21-1684]MCX2751571.1 RsmD family RNA methyltransferase [Campylobacter sp. MIT 21-1682]MCX2807770.1 RsmD family RNA methyltransferase [Campylobacter sp. MIT 21-1685]
MKNKILRVTKSASSSYKKKREKYTKKLFTFIESGIYKGKKLLLPSFETTRSTKSIVSTCVFNVLRGHLQDVIFIEAFGGSALMAALALSNGALRAYAIELDMKAYFIALENAKIFENTLFVINGNTFEVLQNLVQSLEKKLVLYFDPPFDIREGFKDIYERIFALLKELDCNKIFMVIIEHRSNKKTPEFLENFVRVKLKKFGSSSLSFYENVEKK